MSANERNADERNADSVPRCDACYGTGDGSAVCRRPEGHPSYADDGIGHAPQMTRSDRRQNADSVPRRDKPRDALFVHFMESERRPGFCGALIHDSGCRYCWPGGCEWDRRRVEQNADSIPDPRAEVLAELTWNLSPIPVFDACNWPQLVEGHKRIADLYRTRAHGWLRMIDKAAEQNARRRVEIARHRAATAVESGV